MAGPPEAVVRGADDVCGEMPDRVIGQQTAATY
jgi:hypothetical protein